MQRLLDEIMPMAPRRAPPRRHINDSGFINDDFVSPILILDSDESDAQYLQMKLKM